MALFRQQIPSCAQCFDNMQDVPRPEPTCDETLLVNELIREYLIYNGLPDTLSVFLPGWCDGQQERPKGLSMVYRNHSRVQVGSPAAQAQTQCMQQRPCSLAL